MSDNIIIADSFGRSFPYLRMSLTEVCNFKCSYCLPNGYQKDTNSKFLEKEEALRLARAFAGLGVWKIRLTGGEPTVRKDFLEIAEAIHNIDGVEKLCLTTNGYHLDKRAKEYYDAGIGYINISVDSLRADSFKNITGHNRLSEVLKGIDSCFAAGFKKVKLNTVLLKGLNDNELDGFIDFVADKPISLRFIELMQMSNNSDYFKKHHLSGDVITEKLLERGWQMAPRKEGAGPAVEFLNADSMGSIGLIAPYSKDFCKTCNRLRVTAKGDLQLCLFGQAGFSLRPYLQHDEQMEELQDKIKNLLSFKVKSHELNAGGLGKYQSLSSIGG